MKLPFVSFKFSDYSLQFFQQLHKGVDFRNSGTIKLNLKGFSLIEILIVVAIIGIMSGVGSLVAATVQKNTRDTQREADLRVIQSALQQYYADNNKYPNNTLNTTISSGGTLTSCTAYTGTCPSASAPKTYLTNFAKDPSGTSGTVYYYLPLLNSSSSTTCDASTGTCHYYKLCAKKEGLVAGTKCNSAVGNYNFEVTPL